MGKNTIKKQLKKDALMKSAYELFTSEGFTNTTIRDIAIRAGVAKGTFYLYFKDKVDIREAVIRSTAGRLLQEACSSFESSIARSTETMEVADIFIYIIDFLLDTVSKDPLLIKFLSKHLSWGLFYSHAPREAASIDDSYSIDVENYVISKLNEYNVRISNLKFLLFTLLELVSSTCHDVILYKEPASLEEYKPYLNDCIRLLVNNSIIGGE